MAFWMRSWRVDEVDMVTSGEWTVRREDEFWFTRAVRVVVAGEGHSRVARMWQLEGKR